jgi:hypothetical protein
MTSIRQYGSRVNVRELHLRQKVIALVVTLKTVRSEMCVEENGLADTADFKLELDFTCGRARDRRGGPVKVSPL